jgi:hypothetical protein
MLPDRIPEIYYFERRRAMEEKARMVAERKKPEYIPPPRKSPRKIIVDLLSPGQKALCGLDPGEQDLLVIARKRKLQKQIEPNPDPNSIPPKKGVKVPDVWNRENAARESRKAKLRRTVDREERIKKLKEERLEKKIAADMAEARKRAVEIDEERSKRHAEKIIRLAEAEEKKKETKKNKLRENWDFARPTRASQLKDEVCRRNLENKFVEERRQKLNDELRKDRERQQSEKLRDVLERLKPSSDGKGSAERRRKEMRDHERRCRRNLQVFEKHAELLQPMLARLYGNENVGGTNTEEDDTDINMINVD